MTEPTQESLNEAAEAAGYDSWAQVLRYVGPSSRTQDSISAHARTLDKLHNREPVDQWRGLRDAIESASVDGPTACEVICGLRDRGLTITKEQPHV